LSLCGHEGISSEDSGPCSMGVDQGKELHVVIGKRWYNKGKIVHLGVYKDWEELDRLTGDLKIKALQDNLNRLCEILLFSVHDKDMKFLKVA
jgi:hypothetical protein